MRVHPYRLVFASFLLLALAGSFQVLAQGPKRTCTDPNHKQFDFWIGEWDVFQPDGKLVGINKIEAIMDGCVLQEKWTGSTGTMGTSLNYYNVDTGKWTQYWVWQTGSSLPLLEGSFSDGKMILAADSVDKQGKPIKMKITWFDNEDRTVRQLWEISNDDGKTWNTAFDGLYKKRKPSSDKM